MSRRPRRDNRGRSQHTVRCPARSSRLSAIRGTRVPTVKCKPLQTELPTEELLREWSCLLLAEHGIPTIIYYPRPLHLQRVYAELGFKEGDFPVAEDISRKILPLPIYPELTDAQADYVIETIKQFNW